MLGFPRKCAWCGTRCNNVPVETAHWFTQCAFWSFFFFFFLAHFSVNVTIAEGDQVESGWACSTRPGSAAALVCWLVTAWERAGRPSGARNRNNQMIDCSSKFNFYSTGCKSLLSKNRNCELYCTWHLNQFSSGFIWNLDISYSCFGNPYFRLFDFCESNFSIWLFH